jgi:hypothetical protein
MKITIDDGAAQKKTTNRKNFSTRKTEKESLISGLCFLQVLRQMKGLDKSSAPENWTTETADFRDLENLSFSSDQWKTAIRDAKKGESAMYTKTKDEIWKLFLSS